MALADRRLAWRIFLYYLLTFGALLLLGKLFPGLLQFMASTVPDAATDSAQLQETLQGGAMVDPLPAAEGGLFSDRALALLIALFSTVLFTVPLAWTFSLSRPTEQYSSIRETIFLLPITVASVVVIVQHSIALAFSLAGIVAAVRFRSNIKTPADAMFVFAALAIGLAAGVSEIAVAGIGSMFFCLTYIVLRMSGVVHEQVVPAELPATDQELTATPEPGGSTEIATSQGPGAAATHPQALEGEVRIS